MGVTDEKSRCTTSLESMVDFSASILGKDIVAISTTAEKSGKMEYGIMGVNRAESGNAVMACHKEEYLYAVFYCHTASNTVMYKVSLLGSDGSGANAVALCHQDASEWDPEHIAFQMLKVNPGDVPVCHFLPEDHLAWINMT